MEQNPAYFHSNKIRSLPTDVFYEPNALDSHFTLQSQCVWECACVFECVRGKEETGETCAARDRHLTRPSAGLDLCNLSWKVFAFVQAQNTMYDKFVTQVWLFCKPDKEREKRRGGGFGFPVWWVMITIPGWDLNAHWSVMCRKSN